MGGIDLGEDPPGARDEQLAGVGDRNAARRALDEREADLLLQPADLLGQCGLSDVLTSGGAREVALLGERDEVAQLAEFHKLSL